MARAHMHTNMYTNQKQMNGGLHCLTCCQREKLKEQEAVTKKTLCPQSKALKSNWLTEV